MGDSTRDKQVRAFLEQHGDVADLETSSGIPLKLLYGPDSLGIPGRFPFLRGIHPSMYRARPWTMRQYAGFGTARETNLRFRHLLEAGQTGLSVAFDLPTQMGYDPDHELARLEVGKVGVSIASLDDMLELFSGIPLARVSTSMTINTTAVVLLALYVAVAREQGVPLDDLSGTIQNDILKEYAARGTWRFPVDPSLRIITDIFAWTSEHLPRFNPISISGYHMREAGCTAVQELGFTLSNAIAYVQVARDRGLDVDNLASRLSFFWSSHNDFFEEIAKFRAARRLWANLLRERFDIRDERSMRLRFHTQTAGSTLTSQQADNNVVRVTLQALAAVLGGTQSLHTNSADEALSLPSEEAARLALRTQQIIACESGVAATVDPLGGCPFVEELTAELERRARALVEQVDQLGGAARAIQAGFVQRQIMQSARSQQQSLETGATVVVGVNAFEQREDPAPEPFVVDDAVAEERWDALARLRERRENGPVQDALSALLRAARGEENLVPRVLTCIETRATLGEICEQLSTAFGQYREVAVF